MHLGDGHQSKRRRGEIRSKASPGLSRTIDTLAYIASSLSLLFTLDQLRIIWIDGTTEGVSIFAWTFYTISSLVWFLYGIVHKDRVLLITQFVWVVFSLLVVLGLVIR